MWCCVYSVDKYTRFAVEVSPCSKRGVIRYMCITCKFVGTLLHFSTVGSISIPDEIDSHSLPCLGPWDVAE